jgi:chemotaxis protein histidine kinase CheA
MAGKISMQSTIDVGTIFSVQLPFLMTSLNPETDLMIHVDKKNSAYFI